MKILPLSKFSPIPVQRSRIIARTPLQYLSTAQLIAACGKSTQELEKLALDAEVQSVSDIVGKRHEFLNQHPEYRNPEEIN